MVKEFEDSPRDEVAVLLDGDAAGVAGSAPDSSFDAAVRAAGSIVRAHVRGGRPAVLVLNTREREVQSVTTDGPEWERALGVLAGAVPDARTPASALLDSAEGPAARSLELVVVTSCLEPALVRRLLDRALSHRPVALVYVDAPTFAGRPSTPQPALLQLQASGVPVAVVRRGDDLREVLGGASSRPGARWRPMRRTLLAAGVAGAVIACHVAEPRAAARGAGDAPRCSSRSPLPSRRSRAARLRAVGSVIAAVVAVRLAFGVWLPLHPVGGIGAVWTQFDNGFLDFYSTHLPFDPGRARATWRRSCSSPSSPSRSRSVFSLRPESRLPQRCSFSWARAGRQPSSSRRAASTLGAAILGAALVVLAAAGSRRISGYAVPFALALVLGGIVVGTATASNTPVVNWQSWSVARGSALESVQFVWDARYQRAPLAEGQDDDARGALEHGAGLSPRRRARRLRRRQVGRRPTAGGGRARAGRRVPSRQPDASRSSRSRGWRTRTSSAGVGAGPLLGGHVVRRASNAASPKLPHRVRPRFPVHGLELCRRARALGRSPARRPATRRRCSTAGCSTSATESACRRSALPVALRKSPLRSR